MTEKEILEKVKFASQGLSEGEKKARKKFLEDSATKEWTMVLAAQHDMNGFEDVPAGSNRSTPRTPFVIAADARRPRNAF